MKLQEYQAKQIFAKHGIRIPRGSIAQNLEDVKKIAKELDGKVVLKAQVLVGGRGKAGGIKKAFDVDSAIEIAKKMFGSSLKGEFVRKIYLEELVEIQEEWYLSIALDRVEKCFSLIFSTAGGMDIEEIAEKYPEKIIKVRIDPRWGLWDYQIREVLSKAKVNADLWKEMNKIIKVLYRILVEYEAEIVEINPLVLTKNGLIAADAKITIDDNAVFRHKELEAFREYGGADEVERKAIEEGLNYVKLDGNVGVIANGAGMAMATMDLIYLEGGKPANFLDIGGGAGAETTKKAFEILSMDKNVKVIFMNIFGGITRGDEVALGIVKAFNELNLKIPIILRLSGTNEEEGRKIIEQNLSGRIEVVRTMEEGAKRAVEVAKCR
ncbi:MAG: ADP-forming succinate--CoA ligase subunit beta [Archaeoglobaceae archaeon]|nr:ADP-forming succinate--CoA ligase subunit beta [Archaeoglobaceae archaeon]MDW8118139.1 ADP-forming succinate--CoA ligase subunit beta [Archaeoglobaceae archaeon]